MTPFELEVLMHHCISSAPFPREDARAYGAAVEYWVVRGCLDMRGIVGSGEAVCKHTDMGLAMLQLICDTPLPQQTYIDPRNGRVVGEEEPII